MTVIEIPDEQAAALRQKAALQGLSLKDWLAKLADVETPRKPLKSSRGILAKYGPAPSAEDIQEARRAMFQAGPQD
jgi:hypothetical protein